MMTDEADKNSPKRNYKWPWLLLAAVLLFLALAVVWVSFAVKQVERERGVGGAVPAGAK